MTCDQSSGVVIAFDFGFRRIGIASGNLHTQTASPLKTLSVRDKFPWKRLDTTIDDWHPQQLVVGLPSSDHAREVTRRAEEFIVALRDRYGIPVASVDESFTSRAAHSELKAARQSGILKTRVRKDQIDSHAACLIAEQWMSG